MNTAESNSLEQKKQDSVAQNVECTVLGKSRSTKRLSNDEAKRRAFHSAKLKNNKFIGFVGGEYINQRTRCIFSCEKHGFFEMSFDNATNQNQGCPTCGGTKKKSEQEQINRIIEACNERGVEFLGFDGKYLNQKTYAKFNCKLHGDFLCTVTNFINKGSSCWSCGGTKKIKNHEVINKSIIKCEEKNLSFVGIENEKLNLGAKSNLILECKIHGKFITNYSNHVYDSCSCPKCSGNDLDISNIIIKKLNDIEKIKKIKIISFNGGRIKTKDRVTMRCEKHGDWDCYLSNVLSGTGCPLCSSSGFDQKKNGFVYLLLSKCGKFAKIGITNKIERRIRELKHHTPFEFLLLKVVEFSIGVEAMKLEKIILSKNTNANMHGFDGSTEWLVVDEIKINSIKSEMDEYRND